MTYRLKSLELQGYKTFASRTLFEFGDRVTAIVGPNGSGKSNIADSLRWVLGEQSYSLLRAKKTEDMIFSGSENRSRAGMASATLIFDNSDGWLPIDFSEVAITRRAYRDGQNEYLINNQRVRLKDVSELLAQSGLAERTYTIIGQGLVDAALSLKAEERRRLFEEAAGIGLHRSRREEALRRLDHTRRNLERVHDILSELRPRLRSLERQARRAREYDQVKADLQELLREWYGYHWHRGQRELAEARRTARDQEVRLDEVRRKAEELDARLAEKRDRIQTLRAGLNSWHRQLAQLHGRRETISRDLAVAEERQRALEEQRQAAEREAARYEEELGLQDERRVAAQAEVQRRESELSEAREQLEAAREALRRRQADREQSEKAVQEARQSLGGLSARQGRLQARLAERRSQAERDRRELEAVARGLEEARRTQAEAEERHRAAQADLETAQKKRETAERALSDHRSEIERVEAERKSAQEARAAVQAEIARLQAGLDVLEGAEKALSGYTAGARRLLKAQPKGLRGALSNFLDVPVELERAVVAALGEYLDAVLLEADPDGALDLLGEAAERGVLLPLARLKPQHPAHGPLDGDGILGWAADLVRTPPELRPAVDLLLGSVVVVRDRAAARRVLAGASDPLQAVTLEGEVFHAQGPVISGGLTTGEEGGAAGSVLSRQRRRRELKQEVEGGSRRLAELDGRIQALDRRLAVLRDREARLESERKAARAEEGQAGNRLGSARLAAEQARRQADWQAEQSGRLQAEIENGHSQAQTFEQDLSALETELENTRERLRERNSALAALNLEEHQTQVSYWNTQAAVAEQALENARARLRERERALEDARENRAGLQARVAEMERALEELQAQKAERRRGEAEIGGEIENLRRLIEPAEADLSRVEAEQIELQEAETAARQALSQAEHHHAQARINLARRQEAFESLRQKIEDDFGLVQFDYDDTVSGPTPLPFQGMVEQLPRVERLSPEVEENLKRQRTQLRRMGAINPEAQAEYEEVKTRFQFLTEQVSDLDAAEAGVRQVIAELDHLMEQAFQKTFDAVAIEFKEIFSRLFGGGAARLVLTDPDDLTETGIDIEARLPGRRTQGLSLLSGGERSLTATALVFSLLKVAPTPFCVLDEVDAMLDEANVGRFRELLRELSRNTQFVIVTHNRNTVQAADVIYGVTMGRDSVSQVISLKLDEVSKVVA